MERRALRGRTERHAQYVDAHAAAKERHIQSWSSRCQEPRGPNYRTVPCRNFAYGVCAYGDNCGFINS
eukprot:2674627-Heterocapsa_arctica.AAC.1